MQNLSEEQPAALENEKTLLDKRRRTSKKATSNQIQASTSYVEIANSNC
jgi:hypothetical protein